MARQIMSDSNPPRLLSFTLDDWPVLGGPVTISLNDGVAVLVGRNGAGKSAILEGFKAISVRAIDKHKVSFFRKHTPLLNYSYDSNTSENIPKVFSIIISTPTGRRLEYKYSLTNSISLENGLNSDNFISNSSDITQFSWNDCCQYLDRQQEIIWSTENGIVTFKNSSSIFFNSDFMRWLGPRTGLLDVLYSAPQKPDEIAWIYTVLKEVLFFGKHFLFRTSWYRHPISLRVPSQGYELPELPTLIIYKIRRCIERGELEEVLSICRRIGLGNEIIEKKYVLEGKDNEYYSEVFLDEINIGLLSDGTLRILSIILDMINLESASTIIIEEPESQIHPGMLEKLLNEIESYCYGQNLILSTHSPQVVSWTQPNKINLVHRENGRTFVRKLGANEIHNVADYLNEEGDLGDWIYSGILDE